MKRKRLMITGILLATLVAFILFCQWVVIRAGKDRLYDQVEAIPARDVGLLLGISSKLGDGSKNWFFEYRIRATAELYKAGKIRHILVSGDNHTKGYDETAMMKKALIEAGVPDSAMTMDYAGFRTLDSIVRANKVFGLTRFTIISQRFHDERALMIARHYNLDAIGYCATDVELRYCFRTMVREAFARVKAVLDLYILQTPPKFLGKEEKIRLD